MWHELPWPRPGLSPDPSQTPTHPGLGAVVSQKPSRAERDFLAEVIQLLRRYFVGDPVPLCDVPVDLEYETLFHTRCATALRDVPRGEVVTYAELAGLADAPGAARAAGTFCARNRLGLFVPCHRVVSAAGLGSYGSHGVAYKSRLLALEGYAHAV